MRTKAGYERLVVFADACVAIAITLLVLPLVDIDVPKGASVASVLADNWASFFAFVLSFVVIARLWRGHHQIGEYMGAYDGSVVLITFVYVLAIVFLPFPTELLGRVTGDRTVYALYVGTLLVCNTALSVLSQLVARRPALRREGVSEYDVEHYAATWWINPVLLLAALVLAVAFPRTIGIWALFLLVLDGAISGVVEKRFHERRSAARSGADGGSPAGGA